MPKRLKEAGIEYGMGGSKKTQYMSGGRMMDVPGMYDTPQMKSGGSKPDFLDLDKDGNTTEPMKSTYKTGGMYDGMDSPQPKGISHKSFRK
tara:strand:+ start:38 stop:310 length:273 start_codon:yes stop_codon:yes gene_type:complete